MKETEDARARYARMLAGEAGGDVALERAFATVPRESFLGAGPWLVEGLVGFIQAPPADPSVLYRDVLVALAADRGINNGQPSLHARSLAAVRVRIGEVVVHIGAGTGYYTAILAELAGRSGRIHAYEIERDLAECARTNLAAWPIVEVHAQSACEGELPPADVIYVNAGATHPPASWLDALRPGGRLLFPLTADDGMGGMLLVTRRANGRDGREAGEAPDRRGEHYQARLISSVVFIACHGARSKSDSHAVAAAFRNGHASAVRSLWRGGAPDRTAWCVGSGWWLSTAE